MSILQERDPMTTFLQPFYINDSVHKKKKIWVCICMFGIFGLDIYLYIHHQYI